MINCSQKTLNKILNIVSIAQSNMDVTALREDLLPCIQRLFRSSSCTFFISDDNEKMVDPVSVGIDESYLNLYQTHYCKQNPFDPNLIKYHIPQHKETQIVIDTDLFKISEFTKTEYYNDFLKPQDIHNQMIIFLRPKGKLAGVIGVHRSKKENEFKENEFKIGNILAPHLALALKNAQSYALVKKKRNFYHAISECKSTGFFIVNEDLSVVYANSKGFEICHKIKKEFSLDCNTPTFFLPPVLYKVVSELKREWGNKRILENIDTDRYLVNLQTFDNKSEESGKNKFLLSVEDIPAANVINYGRLKKEYAISAREIEIINYVHKGFKNSEIAQGLFISEGTVKNHLKNIFRKIGVQNRTSLIHEVVSV